jgi:hypothetical protein
VIHVWQLFGPNVPESVQAVERIGEFAQRAERRVGTFLTR